MTSLQHIFLIAGAAFGFLGVAAGAFGAHLLKSKLPVDAFEVFEVAVRYQLYHALALIGLVAIMGWLPSAWLTISGWMFIIGIFIFSGTLYTLVLSGQRYWGVVTPLGGLLLLLGWLCLLLGGVLGRA
jgi:uncharacterized membrane protein YgdD (TMEM256/DUF423 family)